jgi:CRISPR-associated endonuclease Csn1
MRFRDWGRLSKAFLELEGADRETGEVLTIIDRMWQENENLMECLSDRFTYMEAITEQGNGINKSFEEVYGSV